MKNKWIWLAACAAAAGAYLFDNNSATLTAFICVVLLPLLGMLPLLFKPRLKIELSIPASVAKEQMVKCTLRIKNERIFPVLGIDILASCYNVRTAHNEENKTRISLLSKQSKQLEFDLRTPHCGLLLITMSADSCGDLFNLHRKKLSLSVTKEMTALPTLFSPDISMGDQAMPMSDSEVYSTEKPGSDPGEIFGIREYIPGDAIRQIHWKLSEKCDKTMIREFGLQIANDVLLLLETSGAESPDETDCITEIYASLCKTFSDEGVLFQTAWRDNESDSLIMQMISSPSDFPSVLSQLLCLPPKNEGSVAERFWAQEGKCKFSHVVIVGGRIPSGLNELYNDNRITVLMPRRDDVRDGVQPGGIYVMQFDKETYMAEFSALEV